jgi:hypothetical protein
MVRLYAPIKHAQAHAGMKNPGGHKMIAGAALAGGADGSPAYGNFVFLLH